MVGNAAVGAYTLKSKMNNVPADNLAICLSWGVGAMIGITVSSKISGGHINPAVTIAQTVIKNFSWKKVPHYLAAQYLGAFLASVVVYILYMDALTAFDTGIRQTTGPDATAHIWATFPSSYLSISGAFLDQVIGTAVLMVAVLAITDSDGLNVQASLQPIYLCLTITIMCLAFGANCMAVLNPARDIAPRLFLLLAGYGWSAFEPLSGHYFWVGGIVGPHVGAIVGAWLYKCTVFNRKIQRTDNYDPEGASKDELQVISTDSSKDIKETSN